MTNDDFPELLTTNEAAKVLRMTPRGLTHLLRSGRMRAVKVGKRWLIPKAEVVRVLSEGTRGYFVKAPANDDAATAEVARGLRRAAREAASDDPDDRPRPGPGQMRLDVNGQ